MTDFASVSTHDGLRRVFVGIKDDIAFRFARDSAQGAGPPAIEPL
jgi:hypothetical protein